MSFIYDDKELINQLVRLAQPVPAEPNQNNYLDVARKLVKNLQDQVAGKHVFTSERADASLLPTHLQNLDSLIHFLSFNEIKYNGMPLALAYGGQPGMGVAKRPSAVFYDSLKDDQKKLYAGYPSDNPGYFLYKDGLIAYLRDLQNKGNPILNTMVSKLIDQINSELSLSIPKEEKETPDLKMQMNMHSKNQPTESTQPVSNEASQIQLLSQCIEELPFDTQDIDFNRINKFFDTYLKIVPDSKKPNVLQAIQKAQQGMANAQSTTNIVRSTFPMYNLTPNMVQSWLKPPQGNYYDTLLQNLLELLNNTEYVVHDLYNSYARRPSTTSRVVLNPEQENLVQQQIIGNSKYRSNFNAIRQMQSRLGEVKQGK